MSVGKNNGNTCVYCTLRCHVCSSDWRNNCYICCYSAWYTVDQYLSRPIPGTEMPSGSRILIGYMLYILRIWHSCIPTKTGPTRMHSSRMHTARRIMWRGLLSEDGGLPSEEELVCLLTGESDFCGGLPAPWHCGKADPPGDRMTFTFLWQHYLPATSFSGGNDCCLV